MRSDAGSESSILFRFPSYVCSLVLIGAGKTTVVPSLLLNDMIQGGVGFAANIWVTQPRRISAIGVSERIASERGEKVGETCGYSIKLEKKSSRRTRITLCTTGILLRRLQCDPDLANVSHGKCCSLCTVNQSILYSHARLGVNLQ